MHTYSTHKYLEKCYIFVVHKALFKKDKTCLHDQTPLNICDASWENLPHGENLNILSF